MKDNESSTLLQKMDRLEKRMVSLEKALRGNIPPKGYCLYDSAAAHKVSDPRTAASLVWDDLSGLDYEEFWVAYLDGGNKIISKEMLCRGSIDSTTIDVRRAVRNALMLNAKNIVAYHNHPSNNVAPSSADLKYTKSLKEGLDYFNISLIDHIIVGKDRFFSFTEETTIKYQNS